MSADEQYIVVLFEEERLHMEFPEFKLIPRNKRYLLKHIVYLIFFLFLPDINIAEPVNSDTDGLNSSLYIAQNVENGEAESEEVEPDTGPPPLPPPKIATPIKPIKSVSEVTVPQKEQEEDKQPADTQEEEESSSVPSVPLPLGPNIPVPIPGVGNILDENVPAPALSITDTLLTKTALPAQADTAAVQAEVTAPAPAVSDTTLAKTSIEAPAEDDLVKEKIPEVSRIPSQAAPEEANKPAKLIEEMSLFNVATANLRTMKVVIDEKYNLRSIVYGDEQGYIRILDADNDGNFTEVWKSPPLNSNIRGLFVSDLDGNGETEIVTYLADGNIYIYGFQSHTLIYKTPEGTYQNINCMVVENMDNDPQMELFFIGVKSGTVSPQSGELAGNLVQFDTKTLFEEWISSDLYTATEMLIGNVDSDPEKEIILNTGEILSLRFKDVEWNSTVAFGDRLYLIDLDDDGILELVTEYNETYVKIIDVDLRQEKW